MFSPVCYFNRMRKIFRGCTMNTVRIQRITELLSIKSRNSYIHIFNFSKHVMFCKSFIALLQLMDKILCFRKLYQWYSSSNWNWSKEVLIALFFLLYLPIHTPGCSTPHTSILSSPQLRLTNAFHDITWFPVTSKFANLHSLR